MSLLSLLPTGLPADATDAGAFAGMGAVMIVFVLIAVIGSIFWIWMLIDCLMSPLPGTEKLVWVIVILFLHLLGALLYFFIARGNARPRGGAV